MAIAEIRLRRVERDIETLRSTQSALMDRIDSFAEMLEETPDIAAENRSQPDSLVACLDRINEILRENREILRAIARHYNLTYEVPPQSPQSD